MVLAVTSELGIPLTAAEAAELRRRDVVAAPAGVEGVRMAVVERADHSLASLDADQRELSSLLVERSGIGAHATEVSVQVPTNRVRLVVDQSTPAALIASVRRDHHLQLHPGGSSNCDGKAIGRLPSSRITSSVLTSNTDAVITDTVGSLGGDSGGPYGSGRAFMGLHAAGYGNGSVSIQTALSKARNLGRISVSLRY